MPCIPRRKDRKECDLVIGEAGTGVPHDHPSDKYSSDTDYPLLADRIYVLILHKYFEISRLPPCISAVLK
jgi:hypothetical protein